MAAVLAGAMLAEWIPMLIVCVAIAVIGVTYYLASGHVLAEKGKRPGTAATVQSAREKTIQIQYAQKGGVVK
jgi:hypothetical protein